MSFINKKKQELVQPKQNTPITDPKVTVAEIHEAFHTSSDSILAEVNRILADYPKPSDERLQKAERLKSIGFTNSKVVSEITFENNRLNKLKRQRVTIDKYKRFFPTQKFIFHDDIKSLCKKYGLIYADISKFKEDVPEKNIGEIEMFISKYPRLYSTGTISIYMQRASRNSEILMKFYGTLREGLTKEEAEKMKLEFNNSERAFLMGEAMQIISPKFQIAAPATYFELDSMESVRDYKIVTDDPIFFLEVEEGGIIITAWGDEATDELVINQNNN